MAIIYGTILIQNSALFLGGVLIDTEGYRSNVGMVICNHHGTLFWARRHGQHSWQFPQGGIHNGENPEEAMYRELFEEVGLKSNDVKLLATHKQWLKYKIPKHLIRWDSEPLCLGQKQKWFLLKLEAPESNIVFGQTGHPEFDDWAWVSYWYPVRQVVAFKREVYRRVLKDFSNMVFYPQRSSKHTRSKKRRG